VVRGFWLIVADTDLEKPHRHNRPFFYKVSYTFVKREWVIALSYVRIFDCKIALLS
jgi:hypothetical protein